MKRAVNFVQVVNMVKLLLINVSISYSFLLNYEGVLLVRINVSILVAYRISVLCSRTTKRKE